MRRTRLCGAVLAACALAVGPASTAGSAARHPGFPILACDDPRYPYANHYGRVYRPTGFCQTRRGSGVEGIDHTRWTTWGGAQAKGRGYLVVYEQGLAEFPAEITAQKLWVTDRFAGGRGYLAAYLRLRVHVLARRSPETAGVMVWHGPLNLTLDVPIQE